MENIQGRLRCCLVLTSLEKPGDSGAAIVIRNAGGRDAGGKVEPPSASRPRCPKTPNRTYLENYSSFRWKKIVERRTSLFLFLGYVNK